MTPDPVPMPDPVPTPDPTPVPDPMIISPSKSTSSSDEKGWTESLSPRLNVAIIEKTREVLHRTETVVETHVLCSPIRFLLHFPREWPRVSAFLFGVVLPLWVLIGVAIGFGVLLAQYESPTEIETNDAILAARAQIDFFDISADKLVKVTKLCWEEWEQSIFTDTDTDDDDGDANADVSQLLNLDTLIDIFGNNNTVIDLEAFGINAINVTKVGISLDQCTRSFLPQIQEIQEVTQNYSEAFLSLKFNWNRCWDTEILGNSNVVFHPTDEQKEAARPAAQEAYFQQVWTEMQQELYQQYLPPNATSEQEREAFLRSIEEATGDSGCTANSGGTAWFFFTIMTTVGQLLSRLLKKLSRILFS